MLLRRLRGLGVATLIGAAIWGLLGLLVGLAIVIAMRVGVMRTIFLTSPIPGGIVGATTVLGIIVGAINGLSMGILVLATERGHPLDGIPWWRFSLWGAAATGATVYMTIREPSIAAVCAVIGGAASVGALALARRPSTGDAVR